MGSNKHYISHHYDQHANVHQDTQQALRARATGEAVPLKRFHNEIKRGLIRRFASQAPMLLDLCCGRGGDISKWIDAGVGFVKGLDISSGEVDEARRRFEEHRAKTNCRTEAEFEVTDQLGEQEWSDELQYHVVTCMFAMHYFFESESHLKMFIRNVANSLAPGGCFIATIPSGRRVLDLLGESGVFHSKMLKLEKQWEGPVTQPFGLAYTCAITDTVTEGRGGTEGSREFLTFRTPLLTIAASHGLYPVLDFQDPGLMQHFHIADGLAPFKRFAPRFPTSDTSLEAASSMFTAFVLYKTQIPAPHALPPPDGEGHERGQEVHDSGEQDHGGHDDGEADGVAAKRARIEEHDGGGEEDAAS
mmetsp:Transcript_19844/g.43187  ORF Transcript_19844/g.43187 Transcript_19844/m.43187 type:complete len:361 (-) Transcript_19844:591-1673(-)